MRFWIEKFISNKTAHRKAGEEIFFVCFISLLPLLGLPFIDRAKGVKLAASHGNLFWEAVASGQLYLYSFSLLGTLYWLCQKDHENLERFTPARYLTLLVVVPAIFILIIYAFDPFMTTVLSSDLIWYSIAIYFLYVILYYILAVFDNLPAPDVTQELKEGSETLIEKYRSTKV